MGHWPNTTNPLASGALVLLCPKTRHWQNFGFIVLGHWPNHLLEILRHWPRKWPCRYAGHRPDACDPLGSGALPCPKTRHRPNGGFVFLGPLAESPIRHSAPLAKENSCVGIRATGQIPVIHWPVAHWNARKPATGKITGSGFLTTGRIAHWEFCTTGQRKVSVLFLATGRVTLIHWPVAHWNARKPATGQITGSGFSDCHEFCATGQI